MATDARDPRAIAPVVDGTGRRVAIVCGRFNARITIRLLDGARHLLKAAGASDADTHEQWVPGAFEIPLVASLLAGSGRFDAVICLGCVIRGETAHFEHVAGQCSAGIMRAGLDTGVPVVFGVLTVETLDQALVRSADPAEAAGVEGSQNVGAEAARVALEMIAIVASSRP
ncbi:MAG: 6,7-dimethyl-8-ribityllumazine synthase [Ilumatobacteraceae bacterium]